MTVSNPFNVLSAFQDPGKLWDHFMHEILEAVMECTGECPRLRGGFSSGEMLASIEERHKLAGNHDQCRALSCKTRALMRRKGEVCQESC